MKNILRYLILICILVFSCSFKNNKVTEVKHRNSNKILSISYKIKPSDYYFELVPSNNSICIYNNGKVKKIGEWKFKLWPEYIYEETIFFSFYNTKTISILNNLSNDIMPKVLFIVIDNTLSFFVKNEFENIYERCMNDIPFCADIAINEDKNIMVTNAEIFVIEKYNNYFYKDKSGLYVWDGFMSESASKIFLEVNTILSITDIYYDTELCVIVINVKTAEAKKEIEDFIIKEGYDKDVVVIVKNGG